MELVLVTDDRPFPVEPGGLHLCFDWLGYERLRERNEDAVFADDDLSWEDRDRLDQTASELTRSIIGSPAIAAHSAGGLPIAEAAAHELRVELTNLLRCHVVVSRLATRHPIRSIGTFGTCPSTTVLGAEAALGGSLGVQDRNWSRPWIPFREELGQPRRLRRMLWRKNLSFGRRNEIRILAFPVAKVGPALLELSGASLRRLGIGVATFPGVSAGDAARLAARRRIPLCTFALSGNAGTPRVADCPDGLVPGPPELDRASQLTTRAVLRRACGIVVRAGFALRALKELPSCRALLLPSTSDLETRMLTLWAKQRDVRCGVVQHGIYGFRDWGTEDRLADIVLAWGPAVAEQFREIPGTTARVVPVGVPGLAPLTDRAGDCLQRVLIATTNAATGSALGTYGFPKEFMTTIAPGVRLLAERGLTLELRHHPVEDPARYEWLIGHLGLSIQIASSASLSDAVSRADLVVSSTTSVAFEAAAMGRPVLMWAGAPLAIRRRHHVSPFSEQVPGLFTTEDEFTALAKRLVNGGADERLDPARALSARLSDFATPFQPRRFEEALADLAS